jgi:hypothetical protein
MKKSEIGSNDSPFPVDKSLQGSGIDKPEPIGKIRYINKEEKQFWKDLIRQYLYPLQSDKQQQKKMAADLLQLRNKASLMFFMMNMRKSFLVKYWIICKDEKSMCFLSLREITLPVFGLTIYISKF